MHPSEEQHRRTPQRRRIHDLFLLASLLLLSLSSIGCAETATGLGVAYAKGNIETLVASDYDATVSAAETTLEELDVILTEASYHGSKTVLIGRNPQAQRVKIMIKDRGEDSSKVAIRIGVFGKKLVAHEVLERLSRNLSPPEPAEAP